MRRLIGVVLLAVVLPGCALQEHYKPAGFNEASEVWPYMNYGSYYAVKLTAEEWQAFYRRFPDHFKMQQGANTAGALAFAAIGGVWIPGPQYDPVISAYAFRWTTLQKKKKWPEDITKRLDDKVVQPGDDVFQAIYALGPPERIIWDNDFEILLYNNDTALLMEQGEMKETKPCPKCTWHDPATDKDEEDNSIIARLGLVRPKY